MSSLRSSTLLRAIRTHPSPWPSSHHLPPGLTTTTKKFTFPRTSLSHIHHGRRPFHWQSTIGSAIEGTQNLIVDLHNITHLPWFLTIPLVALTVGAVFRLPFTIYTQRILQRRATLAPLLQAWNGQIQLDVQRSAAVLPSARLSEVKKRQDKVVKRIYRRLGLQEWRLWGSLLSFPFWLVAIDGVRRLCGGPRGLIGSLIAGPGRHTSASSVDADTVSATVSGLGTDASVLDPVTISSAAETAAQTTLLDPSLTYEGCLWFTDLTASDPYHILPLALSATLVFNLLPKSREALRDRVRVALGRVPESARAQTLATDANVSFRERITAIFHLAMLGLSALIGPLTMDLPAALHLYWITSSLTNALFMKGVKHFMPVDKGLLKRALGTEFTVIRPQRGQKN
ncbi:hypothetical protein F5Y03DRAFT_368993 [Xylaria venustula]|nr:hypothetical protein F5Y03DRAFT_368993 [Xylaria venustula]